MAAAAAAASWLMPGKNPVSALYEYAQARRWQVSFSPVNGATFNGSSTVHSGGHEATAAAQDLKTAKMRAAGKLMRLLCPDYAQLCQAATAPAVEEPDEEPEEGEII